jgi:hypothetical protein
MMTKNQRAMNGTTESRQLETLVLDNAGFDSNVGFENDNEAALRVELERVRAGYTDKLNAAIERGDDHLAAEFAAEFHHEVVGHVFGRPSRRNAA